MSSDSKFYDNVAETPVSLIFRNQKGGRYQLTILTVEDGVFKEETLNFYHHEKLYTMFDEGNIGIIGYGKTEEPGYVKRKLKRLIQNFRYVWNGLPPE